MAKKKTTKKKSTGKKPAKKAGRRAPAPKPAAKGRGPVKISTGSGPGPAEIGADLVKMFNQGQCEQIEAKWWSPAIESVEGMGMAWRGRSAVEAKNAEWMANNTINGASAEGPFIGASGFAVKFRMDIQDKSTGKRTLMDEVGVYTVKNGKIIREEFMYGGGN